MRSFAVVLAIAGVVSSNPFPQGVTVLIAPKEAIPTGCGGSWNGQPFGIAAERMAVPTSQRFSLDLPSSQSFSLDLPSAASEATPSAVSNADMPMVTSMAMDSMNAPSMSMKIAALAAAGTGTDSTVTVRSTRTQTRTLTVRPVHSDAVPGGKVVRVGIISQIEDGQLQAPPTATPVMVPTSAKISSNPGYGMSMNPTPAGPKPTLIVTQINDGQIQAPKPLVAVAEPEAEPETSSRSLDRRQANDTVTSVEFGLGCKKPGGQSLTLTLNGGVLKDNLGRTGYIADNRQFQFDDPPQHGSIFTGGFALCNDGYLSLGGSKQFWQCRSGDFYNLYDKWIADQCEPIRIRALNLTESACQ